MKYDESIFFQLARATDPGDIEYLKSRLKRAEDNMRSYEAGYKKSLQKQKNYDARLRYYASEKTLQAPFDKLDKIKHDIKDAQEAEEDARDTYERLKANGSPEVREYKREIESALAQIKKFKQQIAKYEIRLQQAEDNQGPELEQAAAKIDQLANDVTELNNQLNQLLRRG